MDEPSSPGLVLYSMSPMVSYFLDRADQPYYQAGLMQLLAILITLGGLLGSKMGIVEVSALYPWLCATALLLVFALMNSVFFLRAPDTRKYWQDSMTSFIALGMVSMLIAWLLSGTSLGKAGSFRWIYTVLVIGYLVFISMMSFLKRIVTFAEQEDWQAPRKKSR